MVGSSNRIHAAPTRVRSIARLTNRFDPLRQTLYDTDVYAGSPRHDSLEPNANKYAENSKRRSELLHLLQPSHYEHFMHTTGRVGQSTHRGRDSDFCRRRLAIYSDCSTSIASSEDAHASTVEEDDGFAPRSMPVHALLTMRSPLRRMPMPTQCTLPRLPLRRMPSPAPLKMPVPAPMRFRLKQ